jgi:hypothetical protein
MGGCIAIGLNLDGMSELNCDRQIIGNGCSQGGEDDVFGVKGNPGIINNPGDRRLVRQDKARVLVDLNGNGLERAEIAPAHNRQS